MGIFGRKSERSTEAEKAPDSPRRTDEKYDEKASRLPLPVATQEMGSDTPDGWIETSTAVSQVIGSTKISQIIVGEPSPSVEPTVTSPKYQSLPFRPDVVVDGWSTEALTVRGVSQRGHLHRYNGAPRQDDFAVHQLPDGRVVVLVADGVSGAPQSHLGASAAIKQGVEWLHAKLGSDLASTDWNGLLRSTAWALIERTQSLFALPEPDPVRAEEQLATTLLCAVIEPTGIGGLRAYLVGVGDSGAWLLLSSGKFVEQFGAKALTEDGMSSSAVAGLPRVPAVTSPVIVEVAEGEVLVIATDGIGDPLGSGEGGVGNLLREILHRREAPSLIEFAHAVDFSRETFDDDRTLVAVWPRQRIEEQPSHPPVNGGTPLP